MSAELWIALGVGVALGAGAGWLLRGPMMRGRKAAPGAEIAPTLAALENELAELKTRLDAEATAQEADGDADAAALARLEEIIKSAESRLKSLEQSLPPEDRPKQES